MNHCQSERITAIRKACWSRKICLNDTTHERAIRDFERRGERGSLQSRLTDDMRGGRSQQRPRDGQADAE